MEKTRIGIIGCGNISGIYLQNLHTKFENTTITAVCDLIPERVNAASEKYGIPIAKVDKELVSRDDVDIVVNLTTPKDHGSINLMALEAGKHVYVEKPLSVTLEEGKKVVDLAAAKGLCAGGAPDTFMGAGIQTAIKALDSGLIGRPIAATAYMVGHGHEGWHPDPEFYYQKGGGPMFDMGPYYLTALFSILGGAKRVTGSCVKTFPTRTIGSEKKRGQIIDVEIPTHINGIIDMQNGAVVNIITSFDVWSHNLPCIEIYGETGSMVVPDPNGFGGDVKVRTIYDGEWRTLPYVHNYKENSRGMGVADMARSIREGGSFRASCNLTYHVLETMHAFHIASEQGKHYNMTSTLIRPEPVPAGYKGY